MAAGTAAKRIPAFPFLSAFAGRPLPTLPPENVVCLFRPLRRAWKRPAPFAPFRHSSGTPAKPGGSKRAGKQGKRRFSLPGKRPALPAGENSRLSNTAVPALCGRPARFPAPSGKRRGRPGTAAVSGGQKAPDRGLMRLLQAGAPAAGRTLRHSPAKGHALRQDRVFA